MHSLPYFISPEDLWNRIGGPQAPQVVDMRRRDIHDIADGRIPGSSWRDIARLNEWSGEFDRARTVVFACRFGHQMSQIPAAELRARGHDARVLCGGYDAWAKAGLPLVNKAALDRFAAASPSLWVTRRRPKIDRVACPWFIRRFVDPAARILYVEPSEVPNVAQEIGAIPFDIEGVEISHEGELCSFDTMLRLFGLESEPSLAKLALIVRGADTARHELAPEAAGLHSISLGLSALAGDDDHGLLERGFVIYDGLYAYLRFAGAERHNWPAKVA